MNLISNYCGLNKTVNLGSTIAKKALSGKIYKVSYGLVILPGNLSTSGDKSFKICSFYSPSTHIFSYICWQKSG